MIHHKVKTDGNSPLMTFFSQFREVLHGAQFRLHFSEITDRVSSVAASLGAFQKRHEMQIIDAAGFNIGQLFSHAGQRPCKRIDIHQHANQLVPFVPGRMLFSLTIDSLE